MEKLGNANAIAVKQRKEWGEILTGFETRNKYEVFDENGNSLYFAAEEGNVLARLFLKPLRPFTMHIMNPDGRDALKGKRPFKFYFHEMSVYDSQDTFLGKIKREFAVFSREFSVTDAGNIEIYKIHGPFFHPWTFKILENGNETGVILKKWSGLGKEMFTDADNFNITFPPGADLKKKALLLGALFLIDMLYFEQK